MGGEPGDLVAEALRRDDGDLFQNFLVGVKIESHLPVVILDHLPRRFLHCLSADASHLSVGCLVVARGGGDEARVVCWLGFATGFCYRFVYLYIVVRSL